MRSPGKVAVSLSCSLSLAASSLACSSTDAPLELEPFTSGARLHARYYELAGGVKVLAGWHDTERDEDCSFAGVDADGLRPCLPSTQVSHEWFADASCTVPLAEIPSGQTPHVAVAQSQDSCAWSFEVFEIGDPVGANEAYGLSNQGVCESASTLQTVPTLRHLGARVGLDRFVRAREQAEDLGGRIGRFTIVSPDGARQAIGGYDGARGEASNTGTAEDGRRRWMPRGIAYSFGAGDAHQAGLYGDYACTRPLATKDLDSAICPITGALEFVPRPDTCSYGLRAHRAGALVDPANVFYVDQNGACIAVGASGPPSQLVVELEEVVPPDAFAEVPIVEVGSDRIRMRMDATPEGIAVLPTGAPSLWGEEYPPSTLRDATLQTDCSIGVAGDGSLRCLPSATISTPLFSDPTCTQRIVDDASPGACPATDPMPTAIVAVYDGSMTRSFRLGGEVHVAQRYAPAGAVCSPVAGSGGEHTYALAAELSPGDFAPATEVVAP